MIRVIHVGVSAQGRGGVASVIANLLGELGRDSDFRVTTISTTLWREKGAIFDLLVSLVAFARIALACLASPRPVLHLHMCSKGSAIRKGIIARLARLARIPCIVHDHNLERYYRNTNAGMRAWLRGTYRCARAIVTITDRQKQFLRAFTRAPIETFPNAIYLPPPTERSSNVPSDRVRFLFLGKLVRTKGVFELLEAFARLCRTGLSAHLTLGGNGEVAEVRHWVKGHNLDDRVDVPGWLERNAKEEALKMADVFVLPSYQEGSPIVIVEAMAYGLPVIATPVDGIPEMVVDNETGLFVKPRDVESLSEAMQRLASDSSARDRFGQGGRKRVEERHSLPTICARMKEFYRQVAA